jgi:hypothetical protein
VDVTDPDAPSVLSTADTPGSALQVSVSTTAIGSSRHAVIADWNDLRVFDVSDPSAPLLVASERVLTTGAFSRVLGAAIAGDAVFAGEWTGLVSYRLQPGVVAPDLKPWETSLSWGEVAAGETDAVTLVVENQGTAPLVIWELSVEGAGFSTSARDVAIDPGDRTAIEIAFTAETTDQVDGAIVLRSDDPDEPERTIPLVANRPGLDVGDAAPEVLVALHGGGEWRSSQHPGKVLVLAYFATF